MLSGVMLSGVSRPRRVQSGTACLLAALLAPWAAAETVEEVRVVGQRSLGPEFSSVGNFTRLDAASVQRAAAVHPNEVMVRIPGVWIARNSEQEHLTAIRSAVLSGPGACGAFLLQENGVPIRPAGFCNVNNLFELNMERADAVEVVRGPASALYGGNALHGVVNVVAPMPGPDVPNRLLLEAGPWNYLRAAVDVSADTGAHAFRTVLQGTRTDGWRDDTGHEQLKLNMAWDTRLGDWQASTLLSGTWLDQDTGGFVQGFRAYRDDDLRTSNPNPEAYRQAWALRLSSELSRPLQGDASLVVTPYLRFSDMEFLQHFLPGQPLEENGQWSTGAIARWRNEGDVLSWTLGGHLEFARTYLEQFQAGPTEGSPFLVATRPPGQHYDYDVDSWLTAAFYDVTWHLGERLDLVHSLRLERVEYDYANNMLAGNTRDDGTPCDMVGCLYSRPDDRTDRFTDWAGRLGLEYLPTEQTRVWLSGGIGFRAPQTTELYRLQSGQLVTDLDSESLRSLELGGQYGSDVLAAGVTLFLERTRDEVLRDANGFNISAGRKRAEGVEVDLSWAPAERYRFDVAATWARHRYDFDQVVGGGEEIVSGRDVATAPRWLGSARLWWQLHEALETELEAVHVGPHYLNAENTARYSGHTLFNWRARWQVQDGTSLSMRLLNLTDQRYAERADFAFGNYRYFPGQPRRVHLTLEIDL